MMGTRQYTRENPPEAGVERAPFRKGGIVRVETKPPAPRILAVGHCGKKKTYKVQCGQFVAAGLGLNDFTTENLCNRTI